MLFTFCYDADTLMPPCRAPCLRLPCGGHDVATCCRYDAYAMLPLLYHVAVCCRRHTADAATLMRVLRKIVRCVMCSVMRVLCEKNAR